MGRNTCGTAMGGSRLLGPGGSLRLRLRTRWMCGSMTKRLEITVSDEMLTRLDAARGHEPRASFVKRALVEMLDVEPLTPVAAAREAYESPVLEEQFYAEAAFAAIEGRSSPAG